MSKAPDWAIGRVAKLAYPELPFDHAVSTVKFTALGKAFAAYIAEHEQPPADPLLLEAREIAARFYEGEGCSGMASDIRSGYHDANHYIEFSLSSLKRGIELGKAGT